MTLIEERPLVSPYKIPTLVNGEGRFHEHAIQFAQKYFPGKIILKEVAHELEAQVRKVFAAGVNPSHMDSHQHLHMLPDALDITIKLGRKYGISAIRVPGEFWILGKTRRVPFSRIMQALILRLFCQRANGKIERRTESFVGLCGIGEYLQCEWTPV